MLLASVPADDLEPPERHRFCSGDATLVLDGHLRRLARADANGRMVIGKLAAAFLRRRGPQKVGFARLDDYSRERLGMSGRELQSLATVARRNERPAGGRARVRARPDIVGAAPAPGCGGHAGHTGPMADAR
jgi:hypothetical protein